MNPYLVDVSEFLEDKGASIRVVEPFELEAVHVGDETFPLIEPAAVDITVDNAGTGIVAFGTVVARTRATCSRCLTEFELTIPGEVEGFFIAPGADRADDDEADVIGPDGVIDLAPALLAALIIEAPFAPLHDPECAGLCPECGADLNQGPCQCEGSADESHPFSALRELLSEDIPNED